jgi:hypothetical protein
MIEPEDLLAYDGISQDADRLFAAFLDMALLEFARDHRDSYWRKVAEFRAAELDPIDARKVDGLDAADLADLIEKADAAPYKNGRAFLYWFDLRAQYWHSRTGAISKDLKTSAEIKTLYDANRELQEQLKKAAAEAKLTKPIS